MIELNLQPLQVIISYRMSCRVAFIHCLMMRTHARALAHTSFDECASSSTYAICVCIVRIVFAGCVCGARARACVPGINGRSHCSSTGRNRSTIYLFINSQKLKCESEKRARKHVNRGASALIRSYTNRRRFLLIRALIRASGCTIVINKITSAADISSDTIFP